MASEKKAKEEAKLAAIAAAEAAAIAAKVAAEEAAAEEARLRAAAGLSKLPESVTVADLETGDGETFKACFNMSPGQWRIQPGFKKRMLQKAALAKYNVHQRKENARREAEWQAMQATRAGAAGDKPQTPTSTRGSLSGSEDG